MIVGKLQWIRKRVPVALLMLLPWIGTMGQSFVITEIELDGDKLNVYYDLLDTIQSNRYTVKIYSSRNNFNTELKEVTGDIGLKVAPGLYKKITWNITAEVGTELEEKISFQIRGKLYEPFLKLDQQYAVLKRDKEYQLTWTGGEGIDTLRMELMKGNNKVLEFPSFQNSLSYNLKLPPKVKTGDSYLFKIYDNHNSENVILTDEFTIKRKIPLLVKVLPFIFIGSAILVVTTNGSDEQGSTYLPDPIKPK